MWRTADTKLCEFLHACQAFSGQVLRISFERFGHSRHIAPGPDGMSHACGGPAIQARRLRCRASRRCGGRKAKVLSSGECSMFLWLVAPLRDALESVCGTSCRRHMRGVCAV